MEKNIQPSYEQIFIEYIKFSPYLKRRLYSIKELHNWLRELKISFFLEEYEHFFILLEFFYKKNLITPFFKVEFPEKHDYLTKYDTKDLGNDISRAPWKELWEKKLISFFDLNNEKTNLEVVNLILDRLGKSKSLIEHVNDRPGHDRRYAINSSKITRELGWEPKITFEQGIHETIDWYLENEQWLKNVVSGQYQKYYESMYSNR